MRFAAFEAGGETGYGAVTKDGIIALSEQFPQWPTLREAIECGGLRKLAKAAAGRQASHREFSYLIPIPAPEKIVCVGVNFPERNAEYRDGSEPPPHMSLFIRFPRSFTGHNRPLHRPPESTMLDYEGEVAIVIGKGGRRIRQADAYDHVAAITLCNEGTIRDWTRHAKFNVTQGKNWDRSGALGPWLVPFENPSQLDDIRLTTSVNGEQRQSDRTARMVFSIREQIEYISTFTTLVAGDVIVTGTPSGAGARMSPPSYLEPGDVVEVEADGIGKLVNPVEDESWE